MPAKRKKTHDIGLRILQRLKDLGRTQEWLAERSEVSSNAVSKWISDGKIQLSNALAVAKLLEVSVEWLILGEDSQFGLSTEARKLVEDWQVLPEPNKRSAAEAIATAADAIRLLSLRLGPPEPRPPSEIPATAAKKRGDHRPK